MPMTPQLAREHLRDGADCIADCIKSLKRVQKQFEPLAPQIVAELARLEIVHVSLRELAVQAAATDLEPLLSAPARPATVVA